MSRKRPSRHSEDQFALFLERIRDSLGDEDDAKFNEAVSNLVRQRRGHAGLGRDSASGDRTPAGRSRRGSLPERSASEVVEPARRKISGAPQGLVDLIGQLVVIGSNSDGLLIRILMLLLGTDEQSAALVHSAMSRTQTRLELVRRLTLLKVADLSIRRSFDAILDRIGDAQRRRDAFLTALYSMDESGEVTHAQMMRFVEKGGRPSFGDHQLIDGSQLDELQQVEKELRVLNRTLEDFLPRLRDRLASADGDSGGRERGLRRQST